MAKLKTHAQRLAEEWEDRPIQDFDPEADQPGIENGVDSSDDSAVDDAGTEHYIAVGKSKLRQKDAVALGPQYRGARITREALEAESENDDKDEDGLSIEDSESEDENSEYDDPETVDWRADQDIIEDDAEIDSDEAFGESDEETFKTFKFRSSKSTTLNGRIKQRTTAADFMSSDEDEEAIREDADDDDLENIESEGMEMTSEDEEEYPRRDESGDNVEEGSRAALREKALATQRTFMSNISESARQDIQKGLAVRQQRKTFDSLLNIRIRLQKALITVNSLAATDGDETSSTEPFEAAEAAAVKLWNTIDICRSNLLVSPASKSSRKRKRDDDITAATQDLWADMEIEEKIASKRRKAILDRWERKTVGTRTRTLGQAPKSIVSLLEEHLQDPERFIQRTQIPRSCAPIQQARKINKDPDIYDDADFYQRLLKDLVDQRSADSAADLSSGVATLRLAAAKEAKTRKHVDRRASKGRKMRFTVHEKLQNFMAPEDRRTWEQAAIDRFFGTLFGQKLELNEEEEPEEDADGLVAEEEALRLFKS